MPDLSREQMEAIINSGASVMLNSGFTAKIATSLAELPSKARLAKKSGDKLQVEAEKEALLARKKAIEDEILFMDTPLAQAKPKLSQIELDARAKAQARVAEDMERSRVALELKEKALADEKEAFEKVKHAHEASLAKLQAQKAK